jgi:sulfoxide reductase heme-binding subunit YedZ
VTIEQRYRYVWKPLVFIACLAPAAWLAAGAFGVGGADLGADPVDFLLDYCGKTTLNLLCLTLTVTPLSQLARRPNLVRLRRMLGLFAFSYAVLHFTIYLTLDRALAWSEIAGDIAKRPYILIGFTALLMLIPLAATSTRAMMRRLGVRWQKLHRLVYVIAVFAVWHYWWQVKRDFTEPLIYAGIVALLLGYRAVRAWRRARARAVTSPSGSATAPGRT